MDFHPKFQQLWDSYPKKVNKWSANKAFAILIKQEPRLDIDRIIKCAKIYSSITDPKYCHDLGNWLRNDHWRDLYYVEDIDKVVYEHGANDKIADEIIEHWNAYKKKWWLEIIDKRSKKLIIIEALKDQFFKERWLDAFDALLIVFKIRKPEHNFMSKITPNIEWFCGSGVTGRIIEGYYGKYRKPKIVHEDKLLNDGVTHVQVSRESDSKEIEQIDIKKAFDKLLNRNQNPFYD